MSVILNKYRYIMAGILGILLLLAYGYQIHLPAEFYYDENQYLGFVRELLKNNYTKWHNVHPPLWHLVVFSFMKLFGDHSWVWRAVPLIFGLALIPLLYRFTKKITGNTAVASLAAFFLAFDCISLTQARIGMMNSFMLFFMLVSLFFFLKVFRQGCPIDKKALRLSGFFLGTALATKLLALNLYVFIVVIVLKEFWVRKSERGAILKESAVFLLFVPVAMHFAIHLSALFFNKHTVTDVWRIWVFHMKYLLELKEPHTYASKFWSWPLLLRPIWYYYQSEPNAMVSGILCIGNPAIFWVIPIIIGNLFWEFFKKKSAACGLILLGFFTQWLFPFVFMKLTFFHYFYTAMPFLAMGLGLLMMRIWRSGQIGRVAVIAYLILVAAMFVYWYPLLTGLPIPHQYYRHHMWFRSWI